LNKVVVAKPLVLIVGHGSRDAAANAEFAALVARYQARRPELELRYGYLELARPSLAEAWAALGPERRQVIVLPLFLFAAGHVKQDIPLALAEARRQSPAIEFLIAREIGVHQGMVELALQRAGEAMFLESSDDARRTTVVLVGRGSSDPDANADFCEVLRCFAAGREFQAVLPSFISAARPRVAEALQQAAMSRPARLLLVPYLLFDGQLMKQLAEQLAEFQALYPHIESALARPLGGAEQLLAVMDERIHSIASGQTRPDCQPAHVVTDHAANQA
jgi:sirohydrochlorin cobaltochelatase